MTWSQVSLIQTSKVDERVISPCLSAFLKKGTEVRRQLRSLGEDYENRR